LPRAIHVEIFQASNDQAVNFLKNTAMIFANKLGYGVRRLRIGLLNQGKVGDTAL